MPVGVLDEQFKWSNEGSSQKNPGGEELEETTVL